MKTLIVKGKKFDLDKIYDGRNEIKDFLRFCESNGTKTWKFWRWSSYYEDGSILGFVKTIKTKEGIEANNYFWYRELGGKKNNEKNNLK